MSTCVEKLEVDDAQECALIADLLLRTNQESRLITRPGVSITELFRDIRILISDMDGTLTPRPHWFEIDPLVNQECRAQRQIDYDFFNHFHPARSNHLHGHWWVDRETRPGGDASIVIIRGLERICRSRLSRQDLIKAGRQVQVYPGASELLGLFDAVCVISLGVAPVIRACWAHHGHDVFVASAEFIFDEEDRAVDYHLSSVILGNNKGWAVRRFLGLDELVGYSMNNILIIGDSFYDQDMFQTGATNGLIMLTENGTIRGRPDFIAEMWDKLSFVYVADSLLPLANVVGLART
ncbi:MAG: hypothetical protein ABIH67_05130 [Candidatus Uhrbacteria bacterium]